MPEHLLAVLRQSTREERELAFAEFARESLRANGGGPCVIRDERNLAVGYMFGEPAQDYQTSFPHPGTPEWAAMNALRQTLIRKKVFGELLADEVPLYELLQRKSLEAVESEYPLRPA